MERFSFRRREIIALIVEDEVEHGSLREIGGLIDDQSAVLDSRADGAHDRILACEYRGSGFSP